MGTIGTHGTLPITNYQAKSSRCFGFFQRRRLAVRGIDDDAVFDAGPDQVDVAGALALGFVHQLVGALNEVGRQAARDEAPLGDAAQPEADDADVDADRLRGEPPILERPVVALDRFAEALADRVRLEQSARSGIRKQNSSPPKPRVQILAARARGVPAR